MVKFDTILRLLGAVVGGVILWQIGNYFTPTTMDEANRWRYLFGLTVAGVGIGLILTPIVTVQPFLWIRSSIKMLPAQDFVASGIGLLIGLIMSALLAIPLYMLPDPLGRYLPFAGTIFLSWLCVTIFVMRKREMGDFFARLRSAPRVGNDLGGMGTSETTGRGILVDTSAIIDGRIADITQTGFLDGTLIIPRFVLNELQHIADSADALRRNRGRRGLNMLRRLQKDSLMPIQISDIDVEDISQVDGKLVKLAKINHFAVITNDYNLNSVAEIQGVKVLNINELVNAVKSVVLPGEEMPVQIIQEGKESGQGVAYLDDGTMVVVENGSRMMNRDTEVVVTRVLQTNAGRMIFAHLKRDQVER